MPIPRITITCGPATIRHADGRKSHVNSSDKQKNTAFGPKISSVSASSAQQRFNRNLVASGQANIAAQQQLHQKTRDNLANIQKRQADDFANRQNQCTQMLSARNKQQSDFKAALDRHNNLTKDALRPNNTPHGNDEHQQKAIRAQEEDHRRHEESRIRHVQEVEANRAAQEALKRNHEQKIKTLQGDTLAIHLNAVELRKEEAANRLKRYENENKFVLDIISNLNKDDNTDNILIILKEKKARGTEWLNEIESRLNLQNKHLAMINEHFNRCIDEVHSSNQDNDPKERLSMRWNELRNIELDNKKMIIGLSHKEREEVTKYIETIIKYTARLNENLLSEKSLTTSQIPSPHINPMLATAAVLTHSATAGGVTSNINNAITALSRIVIANPAGAMAATIVVGAFYHKEAGTDSDKIPGGKQFVQTLPASMLHITSEQDLRQAADEQCTFEIPIRGRLGLINGALHIELVKSSVPSRVRVITGVPDGKGNYKCIVPATDVLPARTILINPVRAPGVDGPGIVITPNEGPQTILNTGGQNQPANLPTFNPYPGLDEQSFNDLIVVPPLESGDKSIYVMLSGKKEKYEPNKGSVGNIGEFLKQPGFGSQLKAMSKKTSQQYQGQTIYKATNCLGKYLEGGDRFYLDGLHRNHLEIFVQKRDIKVVLNLDGTYNFEKTAKAQKEGRKLPK